jgi:HEAT repeat protein
MKPVLLNLPKMSRRIGQRGTPEIQFFGAFHLRDQAMFRTQAKELNQPSSCREPLGGRTTRLLFSRGLICNGLLIGVCLLGTTWRGAELRSDSSVSRSPGDIREGGAAATVAELMLQLTDPRASIRRQAIAGLAEMGPAAAPAAAALQARLHDRDLFVRVDAARAGFRIGLPPETVTPVLSDLLLSENPQVCGLAALALGDLGPAARGSLPALQKRLASRSCLVRLHSAKAILMIEANRDDARRELLAGLGHEDAELRYFAVNALGSTAIDGDEVVVALLCSLTDGDANVAAAAGLNLLASIDRGDRSSEGAYEMTADEPPSIEQTQRVAELSDLSAIVRQLAAIRAATAGPSEKIVAEALHARLEDSNPAVRIYAADALWNIERRGSDILPVLIDLLQSEAPQIRVAAACVLGEMRTDAKAALPMLRDVLAASNLLDRLLVAAVITRVDPRSRDAQAVLIDGLYDPEGDVRYLSALALGRAPLLRHGEAISKLPGDGDDRDAYTPELPAEPFEEPPECTIRDRGHLDADRVELVESSQSSRPASPSADGPTTGIATLLAAARERAVAEALPVAGEYRAAGDGRGSRLASAERNSVVDARPAVRRESILAARDDEQADADEDSDEGLRPIGSLGASIRMSEGELPADRAAARFAGMPVYYHGYGARRGWHASAFGWEPPAVFFKPLYFEDINLERYGIHHGCLQPAISFGHFFTRCVCLPYKLLVQPPCECIYTLGYERPNNCIPMYCYCKLGYPSYARWCQQWTCPCPAYPECPWLPSEHGVCTDDDCP